MKGKFLRRRLRLWAAGATIAMVPLVVATVNTSSAHAFTVVPNTYSYTTTLESTSSGVISALYQPTTASPYSNIAIVTFHDTSNVIGASQCLAFATRGFTIDCAHPVYNDLGEINWNQIPLQISGLVNLAWGLKGTVAVVLYGWSGGGADVAYYQAVAQNGVEECQNPARLDPCPSTSAGLKPASGIMSLDSIMGLAFQIASDLDPSVSTPQGLGRGHNPKLYLFNPKNGYIGPNVENNYSQKFLTKYYAGQAKREDALVALAESDLQKINSGDAAFSDDETFAIGRVGARPWEIDDAILNHTSQPELLITPASPGGTLSSNITDLNGIGVVDGDVERVTTPPGEQSPVPVSPVADNTFEGNQFNGTIGGDMTVQTFISTLAIHLDRDFNITDDTITGVDWGSSNTSTITNYESITVPLLFMSESGHYWVDPQEMSYLAAKSTNKTLAYVWGASHSFTPCTQCLSPAADYGDTANETYNFMANWLITNF